MKSLIIPNPFFREQNVSFYYQKCFTKVLVALCFLKAKLCEVSKRLVRLILLLINHEKNLIIFKECKTHLITKAMTVVNYIM